MVNLIVLVASFPFFRVKDNGILLSNLYICTHKIS